MTSKQLTDSGIKCTSSELKKEYKTVLFIPWSFIKQKPSDNLLFGFDIGINAPWKDKAQRKTQLMLFGSASNSVDASGFAIAKIEE